MLNKKQTEMLTYLKKSYPHWLTSAELASYLHCTTRTIRNYISKINQEIPELVLTSNRGYLIQPEYLPIEIVENSYPTERRAKLFYLLLKNSSSGMNLFDLSEELFISESTLKNDIQQLKNEIIDQNLQIKIEQSNVWMTGSERAKRRYMISLLYNEGGFQENLKRRIQEMIGYISLDRLQEDILEVLTEYHIQTNQYSLTNIVFHYAVTIERIKQGNVITTQNDTESLRSSNEFRIAKQIADKIEEEYPICFTSAEIEQLGILFVGLQNETKANEKIKKLEDIIDEKVISCLRRALKQVEETFLVKLDNELLFSKLAIHIQSLYHRSQYHTFARNSDLLEIKATYPLIYDLSVYLSSFIQEELEIKFTEDEISFIALHIGSFLEMEKSHESQVIVLLVMNTYHDMEQRNLAKLRQHFGDALKVIITNIHEIEYYRYDFLLTTERSLVSQHPGAVLIHPILTDKDLKKIGNRVSAKQKAKEKFIFQKYIDQFVLPSLYIGQVDPVDLTPKLIRQQMSAQLVNEHFVDKNFIKKVERREKLSSTSFPSGVAVPHSIELDAIKSGIIVMTLQEPIQWGNYPVELIILAAINKNELQSFNEFFERLIEVVSEDIHVKQLKESESFNEFLSTLKILFNFD